MLRASGRMVDSTLRRVRPIITQQLRRYSCLEVERKFVPTANFRDVIENMVRVTNRPLYTQPRWRAEKTVTIRDTYYDKNDQLSNKGIWIRYRTKKPTDDAAAIGVGEWDAKVRIGGDYIASKFMEVQGEEEIRRLLLMHLKGTKLEDLEVFADLQTVRSAWVVMSNHGPGTEEMKLFSVVLDDVTTYETEDSEGTDPATPPFRHEVGEVERTFMAPEELNDDNIEGQEELAGMEAAIDRLMGWHRLLFSHQEPVGKLSAYASWRDSRTNNK